MIERIRGLLIEKRLPHIIVELHNGLAYDIEAPMSTLYKLPDIGNEVILHTHFTVREDAQLLYGFYSQQERTLFRALIRVNGVGPKLALAVLSSFEPPAFIHCIQQQDVASLVKVPGVGQKTAERLVVEMRDRLSHTSMSGMVGSPTTNANSMISQAMMMPSTPAQEAMSGLITLGYKPQEVSRVLSKFDVTDMSCENIIRRVLQGMLV